MNLIMAYNLIDDNYNLITVEMALDSWEVGIDESDYYAESDFIYTSLFSFEPDPSQLTYCMTVCI